MTAAERIPGDPEALILAAEGSVATTETDAAVNVVTHSAAAPIAPSVPGPVHSVPAFGRNG